MVTSVTSSPPKRERESHIPDLSNCNNESSKDNSEATLAEFDLRSLEQDLSNSLNTLDDKKKASTEDEDDFFPRNLMYDPDRVMDGMLVLKCLFCERYKTPIQNDMRTHMRYSHQVQLLKDLPLSGKGFNMEYRADFVIDIMKQKTPCEYYDHKSAKFAPEELN
ncbi:MAG: hypothetical protein M3P08_12315 [Thermoproteota archaeon]|nr:hypothetical protein [Thermoproteota archaeon]